jgi:NAD(P)-dependent dehydrogenase (short-subunit alcohol dehydrogenase family)
MVLFGKERERTISMSKVWFITGTSTGLGRALAEEVVRRGDRLVATVRKEGTNSDLVEQAPERVKIITLDVTCSEQIRSSVQTAIGTFGRIDVLINNAGYGLFGAAEEVSEEQIRHQIETNLLGSILSIKAVLPIMREQHAGYIVQISTAGGQLTTPGLSIYHASKWGIEGFCEAVAQEVTALGIKVTIVEPGGIRTDWAGRSMVHGTPIDAYSDTLVGQMRPLLGTLAPNGDPKKMANAIINLTNQEAAPLRLALGSDTYTLLKAKLPLRLEELEANKVITFSTDADDLDETASRWKELLPES